MTSHIWNKESNQLFDYESSDYTISSLEINKNCTILKKNKNIILDYKIKKTETSICTINIKGDNYTLKPHELDYWIIINNTEFNNSGYKLNLNDTIRLGKVILKVKEINLNKEVIQDNIVNIEILNEVSNNILPNDKTNQPKKNLRCRICLMEDGELDSPLIRLPCKCKGSLKSIHVVCLRQWLKSKSSIKVLNNITIYSFKPLECEICKTSLPGKFYIT